jgi:hypothetical protein
MEDLFTLKCHIPQDDDGSDDILHILKGENHERSIVR